MLDNIIQIDQNIFYIINVGLSNSFTDFVMPYISNFYTWLPIIVIFGIYQLWKGGNNGRLCVATLIVGVIICDVLCSSVIKEIFARPRPCHFLADINLLVHCGAGKSFPSSHAANSMMEVTIIALFFRKHKYWLPLLSILIGISRIFVGVHFPFDVLVGWMFGVGVGFLAYYLMNYLFKKYQEYRASKNKIIDAS